MSKPVVDKPHVMEGTRRCLVCDKIDLSSAVNIPGQKKLLDKQLSVIFVLRELLELPTESLLNCFQLSKGESPNDWFHLCRECKQTVNRAEFIFYQINAAKKKLRGYQQELVDKMKKTLPPFTGKRDRRKDNNELAESIRSFVSKSKYQCLNPLTNPSVEDKEAQNLAEIKYGRPVVPTSEIWVVKPKIEVDPALVDEEDDDWNSEFEEDGQFSNAKPDSDIEFMDPLEQMKTIANVRKSLGPTIDPERNIKCKQCDYIGTTHSIRAHRYRNHPAPGDKLIYACDQCDLFYYTKKRLRDHKYDKHGGRKINKCPHCDYQSLRSLKKHLILKHDNKYNHACQLCKEKFKLPIKLRHHMASCHNVCNARNCGMVYKNISQLREHQVKDHGKEVDIFLCEDCQKLFTRRFELYRHMEKVHGKKWNYKTVPANRAPTGVVGNAECVLGI